MKNTFYFFHKLIQILSSNFIFFINYIIISLKKTINNYLYLLTSLYPFIILFSVYTSLSNLTNFYSALAISLVVVVFVFFIIILSIPSFYFIKGENLFDINKNIEEIKNVKFNKKNYYELDEKKIEKIDILLKQEANKYFNIAKYDLKTFINIINQISNNQDHLKINLNQETKVKDFVLFFKELKLIVGYDYTDLCNVFQKYSTTKGYTSLNPNTVKVSISNLGN